MSVPEPMVISRVAQDWAIYPCGCQVGCERGYVDLAQLGMRVVVPIFRQKIDMNTARNGHGSLTRLDLRKS